MQLFSSLLINNRIKKFLRVLLLIVLVVSYQGNILAQCNMNASSDISLCHGDATSLITFTGPTAGTTYSWTNDTPLIGLAASGNGNINPFYALNGGTGVIIGQIVVTPTSGGVVCANDTFLIMVNPIPNLEPINDTIFCSGYLSNIVFSSTTAGAIFDWTNDNTAIGLAAIGIGDISFIATNTGVTPITALISPASTAAGCENRNNNDFLITVNPSPIVNSIPDQEVCDNSTTNAITFTNQLTGTTYNWINDTPTIGLVANGNGNIPSFTGLNTTLNPITATITVTPTGVNGCVGPDSTFTITVNPIPLTNTTADQSLCANTATSAINYTSSTAGTTFSWINDTPTIGLVVNGNGDIPSFTGLNSTSNPITATITVTPTANGCIGPDSTFTITVNPIPMVNTIADQVLCVNTTTTVINYTSVTTGATFTWINDTPTIGLVANGNGNIPSFTGLNSTSNPIIAAITVTPIANGCIGPDSTFTITVNPTPIVNTITDQVLCANIVTTAINYTSATPGATFTWINDTPSIGLVANGNGDIPSFTGLNSTSNPITATITVSPTANGCNGPDSTFTITVNPTPLTNTITDQVLCANTATTTVNYTSATPGTTFTWINDTPTIGLVANGNGDISSFTGINTTSNPITATITVTPTGTNGCIGPDSTFTITVNPIPLTNTTADQSLCANTATSAINYTSSTAGTTFSWINDTPTIGLVVNGNGDIPSFTGLNSTSNPITATITVTPTANGCSGPDSTFTITVNPTPLTNTIIHQTLCTNTTTTTVNYTSATPGATFSWINDTPSIGLVANGNADIPSFTGLNSTSNPIIATITITPTANGCHGPDSIFTITINPKPLTNTTVDQVLCANTVTTAINYTSATPGATFTWINDTPSIGLVANGNGDIPSFTGLNSTSNPITATITVTPTANGCIGSDSTFTITVSPTPIVNMIADQVLCANTVTTAINYTSATPGATFTWINDTPSIGLVANGNGDIPSFTGLNSTSNPITATITVSPTANGCNGPDSTFTITVNPTPLTNTITDQVLCANTATTTVNYTSATPGTTFTWINDTPTIGLVANGNGDISSFTGINTTSNPITATITVTPTGTNGCIGPDSTFTITVNPTPLTNTTANQVLCANTLTTAINHTSATPGATFAWINDTPSIGLVVNGNGDIPSFTGLNSTSNPITATITVTSTANGCVGPDSTFTITINPVPLVNTITDQVLCANTATTMLTYSSATLGVSFSWINDTPSIGLIANGNGDIPSFTGLNATSNPITATITVTPTVTNGCIGPDSTFTITINPTPLTNTITDQLLCTNTATTTVNYTSATPGATFTWINDTPTIGLVANGNGDIPSFTGLNSTSNPIIATIIVTPTANGCIGSDSTFTITVSPTPIVNMIADQVLCANTVTTAINYTSATPGATFSWINNTPSIGLVTNGNGDIPSFTGLNTTSNPIIAAITVTPSANGCNGPDSTFTITVNPTPLTNTITDQLLCTNTATTAVNYTSATPGATFVWINDTPSVGLVANGNGDIPSFTGINTTSNPIMATITVIPTGTNGCSGPDSTFTITVNPIPLTNTTADQVLCANTLTTVINHTSVTPGATFTWINDTPSIGLVTNGNGDIPSFTGLNSTSNPITATITITPTANGCVGPNSTFTITINPVPLVNTITDQVLCANTATTMLTYSSATLGVSFSWINDTPSIGLVANGNGNIPSFTGLNATSNPITATVTVTPTGTNGCIGPDSTFTITVNPIPLTNTTADQSLCTNTATTTVNYTSATPGATFTWINDTPSIGLVANGNGDIPSFTGLNSTSNPIIAAITVTPIANGCIGPDSTFTITVNPTPIVNTITDQVLCANIVTTAINYTSATPGATFTWINDTPSISLVANGNGDIPSFTGVNTTSNSILATITVTPTANGCVGPDSTFTITINPIPLTNTITDQVLCANTVTTAINYTSATPGATFTWINDTPTIGLVANGNGDIPSFTGLNTTSNPITATIFVTPTANGCSGTDGTFTITVNPTPIVNTIADQALCANTLTTAINYTSTTPGATFTWINDTPSIGLIANGNGDIPSFTGLNTTLNSIIATITVTPTANGCNGTDGTFTITVNPTPIVNTIADQTLCANTLTTAINYTSTTPGATFTWINDTPSIGLVANGNGDISSFTGINTTSNPIMAMITITPTGTNGCIGPDSTFTITINPIPLTNTTIHQTLCTNTATTTVNYTSATPGATFTWINDTPSIGLVANGNADIPSFTVLNTTSNPITATIIVTPTANGCSGPDSTFTITINPTPLTNTIIHQTLCTNTTTTTVNYTSATPGATFSWINDTPSIGLVANGNADIPSFTGLNSTSNPIIATITITPTANGCHGPDSIFTITINPKPLTNTTVDQVLCANTVTTAINYTSATPGATFTWINDTPTIGLVANGNGDIPSFTGLNTTLHPITATITVSPTANGCNGPDSTFTITVNPTPLTNTITDQVLCANTATTTVNYTSATPGATFTWINDTPSIGLVANGNGDIPSFTGLNSTSNPIIATITVTSTANGCNGPDSTFTITINPVPLVNTIGDQTLCANTITTAINYTSATPGATFAWLNDTPSIGLVVNGNGDIPSFTVLNTTSNPIIAAITVTPSANGCMGPNKIFTIIVNNLPLIEAGDNVLICAGDLMILSGSGGDSYVWDQGVLDGIESFPTQTDTYTVVGIDVNGCENTDNLEVFVEQLPIVSILDRPYSGCESKSFTFVNTSTTLSSLNNCIWDFGDGTGAISCDSVTHEFGVGSFDLTLTTTSVLGCTSSITYPNLIQVDPLPIASFTVPSLEMTTLDLEVEFENTSIGAIDYSWNFGDASSISYEENPVHIYPEEIAPELVEIVLIAYSPLGCIDSTSKFISLIQELIYYIPNAFTPDADEINNIFSPIFVSGFDPLGYKFSIFDRWGELIWETSDPWSSWDGRYNGYLTEGTFIWRVVFGSSNNDKRIIDMGHVNVLR